MSSVTDDPPEPADYRVVLRRSGAVTAFVLGWLLVQTPAIAAPGVPFIPPVDGQVSRGFEEPGHDWGPGHRGIDYGSAPGSRVRAAGGGYVSFAGPVAGLLAVTIDHGGGLESTYTSLSEVQVSAGEAVVAGSWLGTVGEAHPGYGWGLHFGVKLDGAYVDPLDFLGPVDASRAISLAPPVLVPSAEIEALSWLPRSAGSAARPCADALERPGDLPPPTENVVVVVAGIASSSGGGPVFEIPRALGYRAADVYRFSYLGADGPDLHEPYDAKDTWGDISVASARLGTMLRKVAAAHPGRSVDLVSHSQGGIVARHFLATFAQEFDPSMPAVANLITISSPHRGAPLAGVAHRLDESLLGPHLLDLGSKLARGGWVNIDPRSTAVDQLGPGSSLMSGLRMRDTSFGTRVLAIALPNDLVVPAGSASYEGKANVTVPPAGWVTGHSAVLSEPETLDVAYNFLRGGPPDCGGGWRSAGAAFGWLTSRLAERLVELVP